MARDFYKILGVERNAEEKDIKKAYRNLAREFHPDANKSSDAETRFKEISEAYQVLSDKDKRSLYDQFGENYDKIPTGGPPTGSSGPAGGVYNSGGYGDFNGVDFQDLLNQARRQQAAGGAPRGGAGYQEEAGGGDIGDIFSSIFGGRGAQGGGFNFRARRGPQKGQDIEQPLDINLAESIKGTQRSMQLVVRDPGTGATHPRKFTVKIPAGVGEGARVRAAGQGGPGEGGGANGDLFLKIHIKPHPFWTREGHNLTCEVPITFPEAALGATIEVPTIESSVKMKIPAGTQCGQTFRLSGRGVPHIKGGGKGDQFVKIKVVVPKKLETKEEELVRELAEAQQEDVRSDLKSAL